MRLVEKSNTEQLFKSLNEDFWNPGKYFQLLQDIEQIDGNKWNNSSKEERDAMVLPYLEEFWNKYKDEMTDDDLYALFNDLEDNNYHTEYRLLRDIIYGKAHIDESVDDNFNGSIVDTGLSETDNKANEILNSVIGQLSDGIWENSNMDRYWKNLDIGSNNGDIAILVKGGYDSPFYDWRNSKMVDDSKVKEYFAHKIKQIVKIEAQDGNNDILWKRNCEAPLDYLGYKENITVRDAYRVYDKLLGRIDRITEASYKDDADFEETVKRDFRLFLMDKYGDELYDDVSNEDVNEYFTGMFYDIEDEDDLEASNKAEDIIRTTYHVSDTDDYGWDRNEEYDDGDTNWAAEEAADADERFENRYMNGGNGATFNESAKPKKEDKRVIMQQGNVTCIKENESYLVFENEADNEVEHDTEESAMQDFLERCGVDPNNELEEKQENK